MKSVQDIRDAFQRVHRLASHQERPGDAGYMRVPADPSHDADLIVMAAIDELESLRALQASPTAVTIDSSQVAHTEKAAFLEAMKSAPSPKIEVAKQDKPSDRFGNICLCGHLVIHHGSFSGCWVSEGDRMCTCKWCPVREPAFERPSRVTRHPPSAAEFESLVDRLEQSENEVSRLRAEKTALETDRDEMLHSCEQMRFALCNQCVETFDEFDCAR